MTTHIRSDGTIIITKPGRCYKVAFAHRRDAIKKARKIPGTMYVYGCPRCNAWHLSREPSRTQPSRAF